MCEALGKVSKFFEKGEKASEKNCFAAPPILGEGRGHVARLLQVGTCERNVDRQSEAGDPPTIEFHSEARQNS